MPRSDSNKYVTPSGHSILCIAIRSKEEKNRDIALHLVRNKCGLHIPDKNGDFPLHVAIAERHKEVLMELLAHGADVNVTNRQGLTPLHMAILGKQVDMVAALLASGACPDNGTVSDRLMASPPLRLAVSHAKCPHIVDLLLQAGADVDHVDRFGMSLFARAISISKLEHTDGDPAIASIIAAHCRNPAAYFANGAISYVAWAVHYRCCDLVETMLGRIEAEKGIDETCKHAADPLPILLAIKDDCRRCFDNLIKYRGRQQLLRAGQDDKLPSAFEVALIAPSYRVHLPPESGDVIFKRQSCILSDSRLPYLQELVYKYGVDVSGALFGSVVVDTVGYRTSMDAARKPLSLFMSAYGGFTTLTAYTPIWYKVRSLFENLGKCQEYELMLKLYETGFPINTGDVMSIQYHHERNELPLDIVGRLNELLRQVRSLKNLSVLQLRPLMNTNVIFAVQSLAIPKVLQDLICLGDSSEWAPVKSEHS